MDVGDGSAPCVLLGDAAYSVPVAHDYRSPTQVVSDGVLLGEMIADAWRNPEALRQVPAKFYEKMYPIWRSREQEWLDLWQKLHNGSALPEPTWISVNERANTPEPTEDELEFVRDDDERGDFLKHFREKEAQRRSIMAARTVGLGEGGLFARYGRKKPVDHEKQRRKKGAKLQHGFELVFSDLFLCEEVKLYDGQSEFFQKWLASRESPNVEEELAATSQDNEPQAARTTEIP